MNGEFITPTLYVVAAEINLMDEIFWWTGAIVISGLITCAIICAIKKVLAK